MRTDRATWLTLAVLLGCASPAAAQAQSSPQSAVPAPLPPGSADTPGGSARNGVIKPPPVAGDTEINKGAPGAGALGTPVIPPPGTAGHEPNVVPK